MFTYVYKLHCISQTRKYFIITLEFFGQHVSTPIESSSCPSRIRSKIKWTHFILDLILEGSEDDSIRVETCCPINSNIIIKFVVVDWYSVIDINHCRLELKIILRIPLSYFLILLGAVYKFLHAVSSTPNDYFAVAKV